MTENEIGKIIVDTALRIHRTLGPGLLESVYETVLARQLQKAGLNVVRQVAIPFDFDGDHFDDGLRADLVVDGKVIIELKSVERARQNNPALDVKTSLK